MTYTTKDYTYVVAGFGTKETSGYSIKVNDVYKSGNAIYADFTLMGPAENEPVNEVPTTPYIVLKYEKGMRLWYSGCSRIYIQIFYDRYNCI